MFNEGFLGGNTLFPLAVLCTLNPFIARKLYIKGRIGPEVMNEIVNVDLPNKDRWYLTLQSHAQKCVK